MGAGPAKPSLELRDISACRTIALGGHLLVCQKCGHQRAAFNSCRNRHCPLCQGLQQIKWVHQRLSRALPVPHFHVVFTMPAELRPVIGHNRERLFGLLLESAAKSVVELAQDPKRLGALVGVTAVLHTWTRELLFHPGGHLEPSRAEPRLQATYLFVARPEDHLVVKIRHYGLYACGHVNGKLEGARAALAQNDDAAAHNSDTDGERGAFELAATWQDRAPSPASTSAAARSAAGPRCTSLWAPQHHARRSARGPSESTPPLRPRPSSFFSYCSHRAHHEPRASLRLTYRTDSSGSTRPSASSVASSSSAISSGVSTRIRDRRADLGIARIWNASATDSSGKPSDDPVTIAVPASFARSRLVVSGTTSTD